MDNSKTLLFYKARQLRPPVLDRRHISAYQWNLLPIQQVAACIQHCSVCSSICWKAAALQHWSTLLSYLQVMAWINPFIAFHIKKHFTTRPKVYALWCVNVSLQKLSLHSIVASKTSFIHWWKKAKRKRLLLRLAWSTAVKDYQWAPITRLCQFQKYNHSQIFVKEKNQKLKCFIQQILQYSNNILLFSYYIALTLLSSRLSKGPGGSSRQRNSLTARLYQIRESGLLEVKNKKAQHLHMVIWGKISSRGANTHPWIYSQLFKNY